MKRNKLQVLNCQQCGKTFYASRSDAKFCDVNCRVKFHRISVSRNGKTWHHVSEPAKKMAMDIKGISEVAYVAIYNILNEFGAIATENAIIAAYSAAKACLEVMESAKNETV